MRMLTGVIYAILLIALSGLDSLSLAAVKCNDRISGATSYSYADALSDFRYFNNKTYAVSKSAVSGKTSLPDSFFAFAPEISRDYFYGGADIASLKVSLASGLYGGARPVTIPDSGTWAFLDQHYGKYLGAATGTGGSLINLWKEYTPTPSGSFNLLTGGTPTYYNWTALPLPVSEPLAAAVGSSGKWEPVGSGQKLSQIVEFDGKLDCVLEITDITGLPSSTPLPGAGMVGAGGASTDASYICAGDLNGDGVVGEVGEIGNCTSTAQGKLCPIGRVDCAHTYDAAVCPGTSQVNPERDMCQADHVSHHCPTGYLWEPSLDRCVIEPPCPDGGVYNATRDRCEKTISMDCPAGYAANASLGVCQKPPACEEGSLYNVVRDRCEAAPVCVDGVWDSTIFRCTRPLIPSGVCSSPGYVYNAATARCEQPVPACPSGMVYISNLKKCFVPVVRTCVAPYVPSGDGIRCESAPVCPAGSSYNTATNRCESATTTITGYTNSSGPVTILKYKARGETSEAVGSYRTSAAGILDVVLFTFSARNGEVVLDSTCAWGGGGNAGCDRPHWNGGTWRYINTTQTSSGGVLTAKASLGTWDTEYYCADPALSLDAYGCDEYGNGCSFRCAQRGVWCQDPDSGSWGAYCSNYFSAQSRPLFVSQEVVAAASSTLSEYAVCPSGYSFTTPLNLSQCQLVRTLWGNSAGITDCSASGQYMCSAPVAACPSGSVLVGGVCNYGNPICAGGQLDGVGDVCWKLQELICPSGVYDSGAGACVAEVACPGGGVLTDAPPGPGVCAQNPDLYCLGGYTRSGNQCIDDGCRDGWTFDAVAGICSSVSPCTSGGAGYSGTSGQCELPGVRNCGAYSLDMGNMTCSTETVCPSGGSLPSNLPVSLSGALDKCVSRTVHTCDNGLAWNTAPVNKCEAAPICSGEGVYDTARDDCRQPMSCPLGGQFACMSNPDEGSKLQCSQYSCSLPSSSVASEVPQNTASFVDDGARDANGNCLGEIYIFGGKASRCRPPGLSVGLLNNCCASGNSALGEDVGSAYTVYSTLKGLYAVGEVAYGSYLAATAGVEAAGTYAAGLTASSQIGAIGAASQSVAVAGATTAEAVGAGMMQYMSAMGPTIAVGVAIFVAMKVLMGGCDAMDVVTTTARDSGMCHYVGDWCSKRLSLVGCVQRAKGFCCYNSVLGRIMAEQGRPQLVSFGADGGWGGGGSPNCRGFTPEEFQSLDFDRMDLGEYFDVITKDMETKVQGAKDLVTGTIQQRMNRINAPATP